MSDDLKVLYQPHTPDSCVQRYWYANLQTRVEQLLKMYLFLQMANKCYSAWVHMRI